MYELKIHTKNHHFKNTKAEFIFLSILNNQRPRTKDQRPNIMSKVCQLTGKRPITGNNVSHSNRKTKRRFLPNIQSKRYFIPELEKWVTLKVSTKAMRNINKLGIYEYSQRLETKGVKLGFKLTK